jgi:hypothetical protein
MNEEAQERLRLMLEKLFEPKPEQRVALCVYCGAPCRYSVCLAHQDLLGD